MGNCFLFRLLFSNCVTRRNMCARLPAFHLLFFFPYAYFAWRAVAAAWRLQGLPRGIRIVVRPFSIFLTACSCSLSVDSSPAILFIELCWLPIDFIASVADANCGHVYVFDSSDMDWQMSSLSSKAVTTELLICIERNERLWRHQAVKISLRHVTRSILTTSVLPMRQPDQCK